MDDILSAKQMTLGDLLDMVSKVPPNTLMPGLCQAMSVHERPQHIRFNVVSSRPVAEVKAICESLLTSGVTGGLEKYERDTLLYYGVDGSLSVGRLLGVNIEKMECTFRGYEGTDHANFV